tara:strand:- start:337 stop:1611 length:1275 start_codon:yes stop_codon:yes gene_type:complete
MPGSNTARTCSRGFDGKTETVFDILFHVVVMSVVLQLGFVMFLDKTERNALTTEVRGAIHAALGKVAGDNVGMNTKLLDAAGPLFEDDESYNRIRSLVISRNWQFIGLLVSALVGFFATVKYSCNASDAITALFNTTKNNMLLLAVVAVIEITFINQVVLHYVAVKPSTLSASVVQRLKEMDKHPPTPHNSGREPDGSVCTRLQWKNVFDPRSKFWSTPCGSAFPRRVQLAGYVVGIALLAQLGRLYTPRTREVNPGLVMCQGALVASVVSAMFLTLGAVQEQLLVQSTINRTVDAYAGTVYASLLAADATRAEQLLRTVQQLEPPDMRQEDAACSASNRHLEKKAGLICAGTVVSAACVNFLQLSRSSQDKRDNLSTFFCGSLIAATCSFLSEFHFLVNVVGEMPSLSTNQVGREVLLALKNR